MASTIRIAGADYPDVPSVVLKDTSNNDVKFVDTSDDNVTAEDVLNNKYFHDAAGVRRQGTATGGGGGDDVMIIQMTYANGSYTTSQDADVIYGYVSSGKFVALRYSDGSGKIKTVPVEDIIEDNSGNTTVYTLTVTINNRIQTVTAEEGDPFVIPQTASAVGYSDTERLLFEMTLDSSYQPSNITSHMTLGEIINRYLDEDDTMMPRTCAGLAQIEVLGMMVYTPVELTFTYDGEELSAIANCRLPSLDINGVFSADISVTPATRAQTITLGWTPVDYVTQYGDGLTLDDGELSVDTATSITQGSSLPVTSGAVYNAIGNVEAALAALIGGNS